jgi:PAS domain S-box-containing protein
MVQSLNLTHILIVDDDSDQLDLTLLGLKENGEDLEVTTASSSHEALQLVHREQFDCVVSDYIMPELDGLGICSRLRKEGISIPFIIFTGRGSEEVAERAYMVGVDGYLRKESTTAVYTVLAKQIQTLVEKHRAEEKLKVNEERLHAALDATGAAIYDHRVPLDESTYHDEHWAEILGYKKSELPAYDNFMDWLYEQVHPDDLAILETAYSDFIDGKNPTYHVEIRLQHKDGHWVWVEVYSNAVERYADGRVLRVVGAMMDISERKKAEQVERDKKLFESILEAIPSAVVLVGADGRFQYVNGHAREFYGIDYAGYDMDSHLARVNATRLDGSPFPLDEMPVSYALRGEETRYVDMVIERVDGERIPVRVSSAPLRDAKGNVMSALVVFDDITDLLKTM